jgi:hypothetical protein
VTPDLKKAAEIAIEIQAQYNAHSLKQNFAHLANDLAQAFQFVCAENERLKSIPEWQSIALNNGGLADLIYERQCEYNGPNHKEACISIINDGISKLQSRIESLERENAELRDGRKEVERMLGNAQAVLNNIDENVIHQENVRLKEAVREARDFVEYLSDAGDEHAKDWLSKHSPGEQGGGT